MKLLTSSKRNSFNRARSIVAWGGLAQAPFDDYVPTCEHLKEASSLEIEDFKKLNFSLYDLFIKEPFPKEMEIPVLLGKDYSEKPIWMDIAENPHMIVAGSTGSGKTVALHTIIGNLILKRNCDLYLVDPKNFEFYKYSNVNNTKVISSYEETVQLLEEMIESMELTFKLIKMGLNPEFIKPKVIVIDEYGDLSMFDKKKRLYNAICKLAQKCRAAKIHIILATQRPSSKVIDGNIKANFPARLVTKVFSKFDSKIVIDSTGAESLFGRGDSILLNSSNQKTRLKIAYSSVEKNVTLQN